MKTFAQYFFGVLFCFSVFACNTNDPVVEARYALTEVQRGYYHNVFDTLSTRAKTLAKTPEALGEGIEAGFPELRATNDLSLYRSTPVANGVLVAFSLDNRKAVVVYVVVEDGVWRVEHFWIVESSNKEMELVI